MEITQIKLRKRFDGAEQSFVDTALALAARELYRTTYHEDAVLPRFEALYRSVSSR